MATEEKKTTTKTRVVQRNTDATNEASTAPKKPWPLVTIGVFVTVVLLAIVVFATWLIIDVINPVVRSSMDAYQSNERWFSDSPRWSQRDEWNFNEDGNTILRGVVVAVTEDSLTISGKGERTVLQMDDDTVIRGDASEIAVDDSVIVIADKNGDSIRAVRVVISNDDEPAGLFERERRPVLPNA